MKRHLKMFLVLNLVVADLVVTHDCGLEAAFLIADERQLNWARSFGHHIKSSRLGLRFTVIITRHETRSDNEVFLSKYLIFVIQHDLCQ